MNQLQKYANNPLYYDRVGVTYTIKPNQGIQQGQCLPHSIIFHGDDSAECFWTGLHDNSQTCNSANIYQQYINGKLHLQYRYKSVNHPVCITIKKLTYNLKGSIIEETNNDVYLDMHWAVNGLFKNNYGKYDKVVKRNRIIYTLNDVYTESYVLPKKFTFTRTLNRFIWNTTIEWSKHITYNPVVNVIYYCKG